MTMWWGRHYLLEDGSFSWLAIKGRILMGARRKRYGFIGTTKHVMCGEEDKSFETTSDNMKKMRENKSYVKWQARCKYVVPSKTMI